MHNLPEFWRNDSIVLSGVAPPLESAHRIVHTDVGGFARLDAGYFFSAAVQLSTTLMDGGGAGSDTSTDTRKR